MNRQMDPQLHSDYEIEQEMRQSLQAERRRRRRRRLLRRVLAWLFVLVLLIAVLVAAVSLYISRGGRRLRERTSGARPDLELGAEETAETESGYEPSPETVWKEGWVRYQGKIYEYNEDIVTFLVMGIDKMEEVSESRNDVSGGQADAIFLVILDPDERSIQILAINRDTMTDVVVYDSDREGDHPVTTAQIAAQHGFGDGLELSCELTRDAVSKLFYDLPISGYVAVNMAAIPELNDALGGVDVTSLEDMSNVIKGAEEGAELHLEGMDAFRYVKYRDTEVFESARGRLARQKQYLTALVEKAIAETKENITLPIDLYGRLKQYMVTDVTMDEVAYLASELIHYSFDRDAIYTMEGTTQMGEKHEEFYPDRDALRDLMIQLFYREAEQE